MSTSDLLYCLFLGRALDLKKRFCDCPDATEIECHYATLLLASHTGVAHSDLVKAAYAACREKVRMRY